jgi:hypothetical protein
LRGGVDEQQERPSHNIRLPDRDKNRAPPEYYYYSSLLDVSKFKTSRLNTYIAKLMTSF